MIGYIFHTGRIKRKLPPNDRLTPSSSYRFYTHTHPVINRLIIRHTMHGLCFNIYEQLRTVVQLSWTVQSCRNQKQPDNANWRLFTFQQTDE